MKKLLMPLFLCGILFVSCSEEELPKEKVQEKPQEPEVTKNIEVEQFIYRGMNDIYLYKDDVPELADNYFSSTTKKNEFLASFDAPKELYKALQFEGDRFSFMTEDYEALEKYLQSNVSFTNGMDYAWGQFSNSQNVFCIVRYVVPGSSADEQGVKRGDIFMEVDGQRLSTANFRDLLSQQSYTIRFAVLEGNTISNTDNYANLVGEETAENPVLIQKVIQKAGHNIGYLMYTSFTPDFDQDLNAAFAYFKSQGVTDLVLDLRYNGGGDGETARDLTSMITGQFDGQILMKYMYNKDYQTYFQTYYPEYLIDRFDSTIRTGAAINSLNLNKLYVLTTRSSASASEYVINGLTPYVNVVQIGTNTAGKYQGSTTLYDSPNFRKTDEKGNMHVNTSHHYAIQPLVIKAANKNGNTDFDEGLAPQIPLQEDYFDLGVLGDESELLLNTAINEITGNTEATASQVRKSKMRIPFKFLGESSVFKPAYQKLILPNVPVREPQEVE